MDNKQPIEERIAALESFAERFAARQKDKRKRYAFDFYVESRCNLLAKRIHRVERETTELAATSKAVGEKALKISVIGLAVGLVSLLAHIRSFYRK